MTLAKHPHRSSRWRALLAGVLAGPCLLITGPGTRHTSLSLYMLLRGLVLLVRCGNKPAAHPALRAALAPTRWAHGDTALVCMSTVQVRGESIHTFWWSCSAGAEKKPRFYDNLMHCKLPQQRYKQ